MPDIFISYSRKDAEKAEQLAELLSSAGLSCWIDRQGIDLATNWSGQIVDAIEGCKAFIVLLSLASAKSSHIIKEVSLASEQERNKLEQQVIAPLASQFPTARLEIDPDSTTAPGYYEWVRFGIYARDPQGVEHMLADGGLIGNAAVRNVFDVLYWLVPHQLVSSAIRDLAKAQIEIAGGATSNQALASVPAPSGAGDIAWWGFTVLAFAGLVYYAVRRRQV